MRSKIPTIMKMIEYRESAEPNYPGIPVASYKDVARKAMGGRRLARLGIVGSSITPMPVLEGLQRDLPGVKLVKADAVFMPLRYIKSAAEIGLMKKAYE